MILLWKSSLNCYSRLFASSNCMQGLLSFSSDPHYFQKLLEFPLVLCIMAALLSNLLAFPQVMKELMELLIYCHNISSFVFVDWSNSQVLFLVQEQSYCCRHFQLHCGDKFYCKGMFRSKIFTPKNITSNVWTYA